MAKFSSSIAMVDGMLSACQTAGILRDFKLDWVYRVVYMSRDPFQDESNLDTLLQYEDEHAIIKVTRHQITLKLNEN